MKTNKLLSEQIEDAKLTEENRVKKINNRIRRMTNEELWYYCDISQYGFCTEELKSRFTKPLPTDDEIYSEAAKYARSIKNPNRNIILTLRRAYKSGAMLIINQLKQKL